MDTALFEELLATYMRAVNAENPPEDIEEAAWAVIVEAAGLLSVPIPTGDDSIR